MRNRSIGALFAVLLIAFTATAQEQQGSIEGVLTDSTGGILPGVQVEAKNVNLGNVVTAYTDGSGKYRFPALTPGTYEVTATLQGFVPARSQSFALSLGKLLKVDLTLNVGGVTEEIQVSASAPLIDVKRSATAASIRDEMITKLPTGRNFTSVVSQASGANDESKLAGISIDGASGAENRYVIDGMDTTDIQTGRSGKNVITDFIDEVQVKSSGYAAEYGGATGGVINVITKSGGNDWSGSFGSYFRADNFDGDQRPTQQLNPEDDRVAEYVTYDKDNYHRVEPGLSLGGPLKTDRFWFFGSYQPDIRTYERTVERTDGTLGAYDQRFRTHYATANITGQLSSKLRARSSISLSPQYEYNHLPARTGTSAAADFGIDTDSPDTSFSTNLDFTATNNVYFGARGGYYTYDTKETGISDGVWHQFVGSNLSFPEIPSEFQNISGFATVPTNDASEYDKFGRLSFSVDGTYFANMGGDHALKAGVQFDRINNDVQSGYQNNRVLFYWDRNLSTLSGDIVRGTYGWMRVLRIETVGDVKSNNVGLFFQDSWTVNDKLTLNLGIRTEQEKVPSFRTDLGQAENAIDFGFGQKLAPRVGFAYDLKGDGDWKVYGSWGVFYDITKLEMPRGSFGGARWLDYRYLLNDFNWPSLGVGSECHNSDPGAATPASCDGQPFVERIDFRHPSNDPNDPTIDPDLDPMKSQEFTLGMQHRLSNEMSLGVRFVHKQLDRTIEDVGVIVPGVGEVFYIANPGFGIAKNTIGDQFPAQPEATRDYDGVELEFTKRMSKNWSIHASYLWSRLEGNYSGLASSDEDGRSSPNVNRFFDGIVMSFDQNAQPVFGKLATDRTHQVKMQGIYDFDFGTSIGANVYVSSGTPVTRQVDMQSTLPVLYLGRESDGRTPTFSALDINVQHEFRFGDRQAIQLSMNITNLLDQDTAITLFQDETRDIIGISDEEFFQGFDVQQLIVDQEIRTDPRFLQPSAFQGSREIRFGLKYLF